MSELARAPDQQFRSSCIQTCLRPTLRACRMTIHQIVNTSYIYINIFGRWPPNVPKNTLSFPVWIPGRFPILFLLSLHLGLCAGCDNIHTLSLAVFEEKTLWMFWQKRLTEEQLWRCSGSRKKKMRKAPIVKTNVTIDELAGAAS